MKTIGLLGGMSWESTLSYYRIINQVVARSLGGLHSARILLYSVDFHEIEVLQRTDRWADAGVLLAREAVRLEAAGAECLVLCTNTMHCVAEEVGREIDIPLLHIADATAAAVLGAGFRKVGLLGTRFTMEQPFYRARMEEQCALEVRVPNEEDRGRVHRIIYDELCRGRVVPESRAACERIISRLTEQGCEGIVLGCTELGLLLRPEDACVPLFDSAELHATAAAHHAMGEPSRRNSPVAVSPAR